MRSGMASNVARAPSMFPVRASRAMRAFASTTAGAELDGRKRTGGRRMAARYDRNEHRKSALADGWPLRRIALAEKMVGLWFCTFEIVKFSNHIYPLRPKYNS